MSTPINRVMGKPSEKMFNCGAALAIIPKDKLTINKDRSAGIEIKTASLNIHPEKRITRQTVELSQFTCPTGIIVKLCITESSKAKCPLSARKIKVTIIK